jgi:trigger factor
VRSSVETVEPTRVKISVVVEPDELRPAIDRTVRRLAREVRVPGFRKGKVPRQVMEARLGREAIVADAIENEAVPEFYAKALDELDIQPLSRAKVDMDDYADGQALEFSATVEVKPELDLPTYKGVVVERPVAEVTDEQLDEQLDRMRERVAQLEVIGRPLATGDFAQIDLRATRHDQEIAQLTRSDILYELGSEMILPEIDKELEGKAKGDILRFNATIPDTAAEDIAGQEVTFSILVKEAKAKVLPDLDDDFAQEASEFDTVEELRADLRTRLEEIAGQQARNELENRVLSAYLDQVDAPLPDSLVAEELHFRASRLSEQLAQLRMPLDQYLQMTGQAGEDLQADLKAQAERAVKAQLVLEAVAQAEGLEATDADVEDEVQRQAARLGRDPKEIRKALAGSRADVIRGDILRSKALAMMVDNADQSGTSSPGPTVEATTADEAEE